MRAWPDAYGTSGCSLGMQVKEDEPQEKRAKKEKAGSPTQQEQTEAGPSRPSAGPIAVEQRPEEQAFDCKSLQE